MAWRRRILSGACPPGITSASKSLNARVSGGEIGRDRRLAPLAAKRPAFGRADDRDRGTGFTQRFERSGQFAVLEFVFDENRHPLSSQRRRVGHEDPPRGLYSRPPFGLRAR